MGLVLRHTSTPLSGLSFRLRLQASHDLASGAVVATEAWPAWQRGGRPFPAAAFRGDEGATHRLLRAVAEHACRSGMIVGINVDAEALARGTLTQAARAALAATGCPPGRVAFEITEPGFAGLDLSAVAALGVGIVVDHYGTGPMSLRLLAETRLAGVKLDAGIVRDIGHSPAGQALVGAVAVLARSRGVVLGACGIETEAERATLARLGVRWGQGPLFATPARVAA